MKHCGAWVTEEFPGDYMLRVNVDGVEVACYVFGNECLHAIRTAVIGWACLDGHTGAFDEHVTRYSPTNAAGSRHLDTSDLLNFKMDFHILEEGDPHNPLEVEVVV